MKKISFTLKALPVILLIAFSLLQGCRNMEEPLLPSADLLKIKDKWRISRMTTYDHYYKWKKITNFKYNAYGKATKYARIIIEADGDTTEYRNETFEYNSQQQLVRSHRYDSVYYQSPMDTSITRWDVTHGFRKYSYDGAGRVTNMPLAFWTGSFDSSDVGSLDYIDMPVTYEGDSAIVAISQDGFIYVRLVIDQNGNIIKKQDASDDEGYIIGPFDHSPGIHALTTLPAILFWDDVSYNWGLPVFSRNNFTKSSWHGYITTFQHTYNQEGLVTQRAIVTSGDPQRIVESYEYMK